MAQNIDQVKSVDLSQKAMLVKLSMSHWTARKYDRSVSDKVASDYGASQDSGRYHKVLVAKEAIHEVLRAINDAKVFHYANTLPWQDDGFRILPAANFDIYSKGMRERQSDFENKAAEFCKNYPAYQEDAKQNLGGLFRLEDYPDNIESKFDFSVKITPLPHETDFRVELQAADVSRIQTEIRERVESARVFAMKDLWERLYTNVSKMVERLSDKDAKFKDSLVNNLRDLCSILPKLNIDNDSRLEKLRKDIEDKLCDADAKDLRKDEVSRAGTAKNAQKILDAMSGYMGGGK